MSKLFQSQSGLSTQSRSSRVLTISELWGNLGTTNSWPETLGTRFTQELLNLGMHLEGHMEKFWTGSQASSSKITQHLFFFLQCIQMHHLSWRFFVGPALFCFVTIHPCSKQCQWPNGPNGPHDFRGAGSPLGIGCRMLRDCCFSMRQDSCGERDFPGLLTWITKSVGITVWCELAIWSLWLSFEYQNSNSIGYPHRIAEHTPSH